MSFAEILWSFSISIIAGIITGALFASRTTASSHIIDVSINLKMRDSPSPSRSTKHYSPHPTNSNDDAFVAIIIGLGIVAAVNYFFANYLQQIFQTRFVINCLL